MRRAHDCTHTSLNMAWDTAESRILRIPVVEANQSIPMTRHRVTWHPTNHVLIAGKPHRKYGRAVPMEAASLQRQAQKQGKAPFCLDSVLHSRSVVMCSVG